MELFARLAHHAREHPKHAAAREVGPGRSAEVAYGALVGRVGGAARALKEATPPGGVVVLVTGNRCEYFAACLGVWAAGRVVLPVHPSAEREVPSAVARTGASLVLVDARHTRLEQSELAGARIEELSAFLERAGEAELHKDAGVGAGLMLQSSGTTGLPKIVRRSAEAVDAVARNVANAAGLLPEDRVLAAAPICHAYGIENGFLGPLWAGATVHLTDGLDLPVALAELEHGCTVFPGVPFMFEVLARSGGRGGSLRLAYSAGGMLPPAVAQAFETSFGKRVGQLYGASELGSVTFNHPDRPSPDPLSVGRPMEGVRVRIVDPGDQERDVDAGAEGLVLIHAPSMMSGYVDGEAPIVDGYFITGDLGRLDEAGNLTITGRLKQLIDVGGLKVNPAEVERVLMEHPGVAECVVVAVPVTPTVSRLKAVVVGAGEAVDVEELRRHARERLAGYKVPRLWEVRESLPRTASGKVLRSALEGAV
jgi:acyl-CoA synthetase (AMP-forming)/AMP-acid ligase II